MLPIRKLAEVGHRWGAMIKLSHSIFAMPFAIMAAFLAARSAFEAGRTQHLYPEPVLLGLVIICMVCARSAAMTFNRIVDARFDAMNPRTAERAIPAGRISARQSAYFLALCTAGFITASACFWWIAANPWPLILAGPVLAYLCFYSYMKRWTDLSHLVLGTAIGLSPAAAWIAIDPKSAGISAILIGAAVTFWIGGFDVIYACQDVQVDRRHGLHSLPAGLGVGPALWVARAAHACVVILLIALSQTAGLGVFYLAGVGIVAGLLLVEHMLVRADDLSRVNVAFFTVNGIVGLALGGLTLIDILLGAVSG
jgi:4-hydroxybenzoate polyprenyltransferase